jgi:hypothetical protein
MMLFLFLFLNLNDIREQKKFLFVQLSRKKMNFCDGTLGVIVYVNL